MPSSSSIHSKTDPKYIDLLNFLIEKTENVKSPMSIRQVVRDLKEKNGAAQEMQCLQMKIDSVREKIHTFAHIDTNTKVKLLFALSASVDGNFLKELRKDAHVKVDNKKRVAQYKANDGSLELKGDHSRSAKSRTAQLKSKRSYRSLIYSYFVNMNDADSIPTSEEEKEIWSFIEFITAKCENVNSLLSIRSLARDFNKHFGIARSVDCIHKRTRRYCSEIQKIEFLDTYTKVRQLFCLSATLNSDYLEKLRKNALVEVDEKNRITFYKANDGGFELNGDHSKSTKNSNAQLESKRSYRSLIIDYFENKNNSDAVLKNESQKEMGNLIKFITEKCENVDTPLNISLLAIDLNNHFGTLQKMVTIRARIKGYCREIQALEFLDTHTKVKQLFGLSATLDTDLLEKLRKDAIVEVDDLNRITKYTSKNGLLILHGVHSLSAKNKLGWIERRKNEKTVKKHYNSEGEEDEQENEYSDDDSDENSSKEFNSEFDSDEENDHSNETANLVEPSTDTYDFENEASVRNRSPKEISIDYNFDFDPPFERSPISEEIEMKEDEENDPGITENAVIKTRSGRLSKRKHLDSNFSYDLANSSNSGGLTRSSSSSSKPAKLFHFLTERSNVSEVIEMREDDGRKRKSISPTAPLAEKMRNNGTTGSSSSKLIESSLNILMRPNELDDHDTNYSIDDQVKLEPFRGSIQEDLNAFREDEDIQQIPKSSQAHDEHKDLIEFPIKLEQEEPVEVKPETSHNSKIKFFEAIQSLIFFLETSSLYWIQTKIHQEIQKIGGSNEVILNNKIVQIVELLIVRMTNHSVVNLSENVESMKLSSFLCYLKAAILNSKMSGVEGLVTNIRKIIEESHDKRISMETVANALRATLDIDSF